METYRHILLAVDLTDEGRRVAERAAAIARHCGARLTLLHVVEHVPLDLSNDLVLAQPVELDEELMREAEARLAELAESLGLADAERRIELGSTKSEIVRAARESGADLIVVGAHERHGLALLLGSTADAVLHGAPCDVLAVRVPR
ncbi:universal stress protein [Inmirania thermothiophila]|uniref:Universal stress protein n=1 Tax=Inmirania thermothiophila TaxID=1750597 RepID=A0A3N1Y7B5_9GAMM|nr:universal stress protein [Inmirania thermothiophila]ROR34665.1 universal stress protein A [Inmirania thermothiophila]